MSSQPESESGPDSARNLLTVDVEDYFHANGLEVAAERWDGLPGRVEYTTRRLLELFGRQRVRATFFVLGWVASRYPQLVREIHAAGHEVASHGWNHELIYDIGRERFRDDVRRAKDLLESITGDTVLGYRAPSFSIVERTRWALDVLVETGFVYDSSIYPIARGRYGDRREPRFIHQLECGLIEVPPSTLCLRGRNIPIAGGGYFRAFPLWFTRWAIRRLNQSESMPAVVYLHPWEIDPDQPRMPASRANHFRHYLNLARTEARLIQLLETTSFGTVRASLDLPAATIPVQPAAWPRAAGQSA